MESLSSSKVTVEYFDPSGVFPLISSGLLARLPLRNLHWKSTTRPLRSIASLHVDLIPHRAHERPLSQTPAPSVSTSDVASLGKDRTSRGSREEHASRPWMHPRAATEPKITPEASAGTLKGPLKERRHQIPGLRQTPYLKVYLLRCDDNETYKSSSRKLLREWIKTATPPSTSGSSNAQENHDAFEWMIVHVAVPSSIAASTGSGAQGGPYGTATERQGGGPRWPGKGPTTVYEKTRADFNSSAKLSLDRVGQIRLHETDVPPHLVPGAARTKETLSDDGQQDRETAWSDLIAKLRSLILASFDRRVAQYEEDIRQRDAQRHLPGWNFCTFFILKEGLARGFESVGLLEDALVGYDELAAGLDAVAREAVSEDGEIRGSIFLHYSEDLRHRAESGRASMQRKKQQADAAGSDDAADEEDVNEESTVVVPLDDTMKRYRDLILSNQISLFDFRCYLFARQMSLLLRQANAISSPSRLRAKLMAETELLSSGSNAADDNNDPAAGNSSTADPEDLVVLAELCRRAVEFLPSAARVLRADLENGFKQSEQSESDSIARVIENMLYSWMFSASRQILAETSTKALPLPPSFLDQAQASNLKTLPHGGIGAEPKTAIQEPKTMLHPARQSMLPPHQDRPGATPSARGPSGALQAALYPPRNEHLRSGIEQLANCRAELHLIVRNALKRLGSVRGWSADLATVYETEFHDSSALQVVNLQDESPQTNSVSKAGEPTTGQMAAGTAGIEDKLLRAGLGDEDAFYRLYEVLCDRILRHFSLARKIESMETTLADLAVLKYRQRDFATAAGYFSRLEPFYTERGWSLVGTSMLQMNARCLKNLDRRRDSIRVLLELIARAVATERLAAARRRGSRRSLDVRDDGKPTKDQSLHDEPIPTHRYFADLLAYSKDLPKELTAPLGKYFGDVHVEPFTRHFADKDGFRLRLRIMHLLPIELTVDKVRIKMVAASGGQGSDLWLESDGAVDLKRGKTAILVGTHNTMPGSWIVSHVLIHIQKLVFVHDALPGLAGPATPITSIASRAKASAATKGSIVHFYPRPSALSAKVELPQHIFLDEPRSVEVVVSTGWNRVDRAELRIRAASAGLRLQTANAQTFDQGLTITGRPSAGVLELGSVSPGVVARVKCPFALERPFPDISVKVEVDYWTKQGRFSFSTTSSIALTLPLGVHVHDVFTREAAFSKFSVSTASSVPLRLLSAELKSHGSLSVTSPPTSAGPSLIFPKQPASLVWKIASPSSRTAAGHGEQQRLALTVVYRCLDEEICRLAESALVDALEASSYADTTCLLGPALRGHLRRALSPSMLEKICLLGELEIGAFDDTRWDDALKAVPPERATAVQQWLREWHETHRSMALSTAIDSPCNRTVTLPFELPSVQVVHTIDLVLVNGDGTQLKAASPFSVGHMLMAELRVAHSRAWDATRKAAPTDSTTHAVSARGGGREEAIDFVYEIHVDQESWLVGGRRRARFSATENEVHRFPVMLLPLRPGHLLLPTVSITSIATTEASSTTAASRSDTPTTTPTTTATSAAPLGRFRCETHNRSQAQTVLVLPDVTSTTVSLESGATGSRANLVGTKSSATDSAIAEIDLVGSLWSRSTGGGSGGVGGIDNRA